jgi:hypothetical protein
VVFLDGLYLLGDESETARHRVQKFVQAGMSVMMLADRRWGADFARSGRVVNAGFYGNRWIIDKSAK